MSHSRPNVPPQRELTARRRIIAALEEAAEPLTARELSALARVAEREVERQMPHVEKTLRAAKTRLKVHPAECAACGFVFAKRERRSRPSKCPVCKAGRVRGPWFELW